MLGVLCAGPHRWEPELGSIYRCSVCLRTGYRELDGKLQGEIVPHANPVELQQTVAFSDRESRITERDWRVKAARNACEDTGRVGGLRF